MSSVSLGKVWLVGAGPGDPDLLTVKAYRLLQAAKVVAYDELISEDILAIIPEDAERIPVGRRAGGVRYHEEKIHPLVLQRAREGFDVVRLKGGDPMVFGRGGEEAERLADLDIAFEFVPGITAALGAAASVGIPLSYRAESRSIAFVTAHTAKDESVESVVRTFPQVDTLAVYMGLSALPALATHLAALRFEAGTPCAVVSRATQRGERSVFGTLASIARRAATEGIESPAILLVGQSVLRAIPRDILRAAESAGVLPETTEGRTAESHIA